MKKLILFTAAVLISAFSVNAQKAFHLKDKALNLGIGVGNTYTLNTVPVPSVNASFEIGIIDIPNAGVISIGAFSNFYHTWYEIYGVTYTYTNFMLAARAAFHLGFLNTEKFDVYGGVTTGFGFVTTTNAFAYDVFAGGRIMFKKRFGIFAEAGYGASNLKAGVTFKF